MQVSIIASVWSNAAIKLLQGLGNLFWLQVTAHNHIFEQRLGCRVAVVSLHVLWLQLMHYLLADVCIFAKYRYNSTDNIVTHSCQVLAKTPH